MDILDSLVYPVIVVSLVTLDFQAFQAIVVSLAIRDVVDIPVFLVILDSPASPVTQAYLVTLDSQVYQATQV